MYDKTFNNDCGRIYSQIYSLGIRARAIIRQYVTDHGGSVDLNVNDDEDDPAYITNEAYATGLHIDGNDNVQITASDGNTYNLAVVTSYNLLDLASILNGMQ